MLSDALKEYEAAISIAPGNAQAHYGIGLIYRANADYRSAITYFEKALSLSPTNTLYKEQLQEAQDLLNRTEK
jgi:tetratricopeptide (TPR) repeat protein